MQYFQAAAAARSGPFPPDTPGMASQATAMPASALHLHPSGAFLSRPSYPVCALCGRSCGASRSSAAGSGWAPAGRDPRTKTPRCPASRRRGRCRSPPGSTLTRWASSRSSDVRGWGGRMSYISWETADLLTVRTGEGAQREGGKEHDNTTSTYEHENPKYRLNQSIELTLA